MTVSPRAEVGKLVDGILALMLTCVQTGHN